MFRIPFLLLVMLVLFYTSKLFGNKNYFLFYTDITNFVIKIFKQKKFKTLNYYNFSSKLFGNKNYHIDNKFCYGQNKFC